ncbi:B-cell receptor CD22-like [Chanos chanos]|uniref:B-cell receptor CD22-like n=1 Tax=Chanos chanos TaxID=29144 RepID=A0A6J2VTD5_CHACN|nr:B-cell receptor CD22-like [Chanos chanos]
MSPQSLRAHVGETIKVTCSARLSGGGNRRYICKQPCNKHDVLVTADQPSNGRYTLEDSGTGEFTVTISKLKKSDSGSYSCVVDSTAYDQVDVTVVDGAVGQNWGVWYNPKGICTLKGSSVTMSCSYTYPIGQKVETVFWMKNRTQDVDLSEDSDYKGRVEYLGNNQNDCSMKLTDVTEQDAREYFFRFATNHNSGKWIGEPGVRLSVTDLQLESPERVMEGDTVTLKCRTTCSLSNTPTFIWYKNGHVLTRQTIKKNELSLQSVSSEDRGSYMCAVQGHENLPSPAVTLAVTYPPKKTTVSVSPSGEIVEGSSVTLTCSSDANPPATYTWFKKNETVTIGKEETHRINKISSEDSGEYHCKSSNQHGHQYSNTVSLSVLYAPRNSTVSVSSSGEIVEGSSVTLTCSSDANPPATYTWFKKNGAVTTGKEETYRINKISSEDSGEYHCKSSNQHGHQYSNTVSLNVLYPPRNSTVSVSPSGEIVEGSSVTLTCSSDANPPQINYTWYKESLTSPNGTVTIGREETYRINKISSEDSGEYHCKSSNQHGHQYSNTVSLNVLYPPKKTTVSVSPSGEIVEGSSVTLTCSSDANPPATYTWFKKNETVTIGKEETYRINKISSEDSGEYHCKSSNQHGHQYSNTVSLNVLYPPKKTTVSVKASDEIVEGSSVTLTCSSDANPPATYTWFKKNGTVTTGKEETYRINKISSEDSGEYHCKSSNQHGHQYSNTVSLNVLYPPRNTTVSVNASGEIVEGSSVTLTCSSDANPPQINYTWYKENVTSPVGYGQSYIINNIQSSNSGLYYCEAQNKHGSQKTTAVPITLKGDYNTVIYTVTGITVCGGTLLLIGLMWMRKKNQAVGSVEQFAREERVDGIYTALDPMTRSDTVYETLTTVNHTLYENTNTSLDHQSKNSDYETIWGD